jgi:hypothetical protein
MRLHVTIAVAVTIFFGALVWALPAVAKTNKACDLITAQGVSSIVHVQMTKVTTADSPDSLCQFADLTNLRESGNGRSPRWTVIVTLFTPLTMRRPGVGGVIAKVGCVQPGTHSVNPQCNKALADHSPAELYNAQPRSFKSCQKNPSTSCFVSNGNVVWAKHGSQVVAIAAWYVTGQDTLPAHYGPMPTLYSGPEQTGHLEIGQELDLLNYVSLKL